MCETGVDLVSSILCYIRVILVTIQQYNNIHLTVCACSIVVELGTSIRVVAGSNPAPTKVALAVRRS